MNYQLEKYHGVSSRHQCPKCGDKHSFAYYIGDDGSILNKAVGRCNHESSCGYHYTPKQYFIDNPDVQMFKA
ncbi:PG0870-related protein [Bacteroides heparinolyticus]|uniref:PG0870-related protein n=1 Tax=Prevotella heparinolytica TaxID=28113 RepID=UPI0028EDCC2A|nr:PG0870-related protein [Bacteroides heparinolyticus]